MNFYERIRYQTDGVTMKNKKSKILDIFSVPSKNFFYIFTNRMNT